ncbi:MAG: hypothetical protein WC477_02065 [Patescibacteria group bacterium]
MIQENDENILWVIIKNIGKAIAVFLLCAFLGLWLLNIVKEFLNFMGKPIDHSGQENRQYNRPDRGSGWSGSP